MLVLELYFSVNISIFGVDHQSSNRYSFIHSRLTPPISITTQIFRYLEKQKILKAKFKINLKAARGIIRELREAASNKKENRKPKINKKIIQIKKKSETKKEGNL